MVEIWLPFIGATVLNIMNMVYIDIYQIVYQDYFFTEKLAIYEVFFTGIYIK